MSPENSPLAWFPGLATVLSLIACYGTLAVVAVLAALGIAAPLNEAIWAAAIVAFAGLAAIGLAIGYAQHRLVWPLMVGVLGVAAIGYAMYGQYSRLTELSGFALLGVASLWDWRRRRIRPAGSRTQ